MTLDFPQLEKKTLKFWKEKKIFEKLRKKNRGKKRWSFLDGPITANNPMGVHHAWGRTLKDLFQRYKAARGYEQRFQNGFDCQGLWVEVEVEKELGFKNKKDIERFGVGKFVEECKKRVLKYSKIQTRQSMRLGQWMDWDNSYYTMSDENNYAIWGFLKKCREKGLLYKGRDVVPWCPRCGTAISQHEILGEEYKEIAHKSVFVKLVLEGRKNAFFLVWTTTPWTLAANAALAVNPKLLYAEVKDREGNIFILLKSKKDLIEGGEVLKEFLGKALEGIGYKGMFDELAAPKSKGLERFHKVIPWEEVSEQEGTGIVHIAPGCGQEDFRLAKNFDLPALSPANEEGIYQEGFGNLSGRSVAAAAELIFENLSKKGFIFKIEDYRHRYPTCWRCKTELIFRLVDEWYIRMDKLRDSLSGAAKSINWLPSFGLERELDWLKNMQDWLISKKRYWGLALPIFECKECGDFEVIGSKDELKKRAVSGWDKFKGKSPHRPWIDEVKIRCLKCKKEVSRIEDVGNPWLDAGIVPFSTMGYFSDKSYWKKWFPADFITESFPGQFKNWFYSLIVMSVVLEGIPPVKTIFGYGSLKDEKGEEMHKSKGNAIWFQEAAEKIGAEPMRWLYSKQNPAQDLKFGYNVCKEASRKLINIHNSFVFFGTYISLGENIKIKKNIKPKYVLDKWIVSLMKGLVKKATERLDAYDAAGASQAIERFCADDLSLWYIRRGRKRFHPGHPERKEAVQTLYFVLLNLAKLLSPFTPFFAEELYQGIRPRGKNIPESVHLAGWPETDKLGTDGELENKMSEVRRMAALALAERAKAGIKVRQPLLKFSVKSKILKSRDKELVLLLKEEINVKEIVFDDKIKSEAVLDIQITEELEREGILREVVRHIQESRKMAGFNPKDKVFVLYRATPALGKILAEGKEFILKETSAKSLKESSEFRGNGKKENIKIGQEEVELLVVKKSK